MLKRIALLVGLAIASHIALAQDREKLSGAWKLVSFENEIQATGERRPVFGKNPNGYLVFTPQGRMMALLTNESKRLPRRIRNAQNC